jgi:tetratricopeptide (TPR) repeat protein
MAGMMLALSGAGGARADEFLRAGESIRRVQITGFSRGLVEYRLPSGANEKAPLLELEKFSIDSVTGLADFNSAEEFLSKNQPRQSVERYERAARSAQDFWVDLVQARLCQAADRAALSEKAIRAFLALAEHDPAAAAPLLPSALPTQSDPATQRALKRLDETASWPAGPSRALARMLHFEVLRRLNDPSAAEIAGEIARLEIPAELMSQRAAAVKDLALGTLLAAGRNDEVIRGVELMLTTAPPEFVPQWLLMEARALLASAHDNDGYLAAALPAMRVAIMHADTAASGDALLLAAEAHRRSGRQDDAARLLRECLRRTSVTEETKQKARDGLAQLGSPSTG